MAELKWEDVEFADNVENYGGEYAPVRYAISGDTVYLTGVAKLKVNKTVGSLLFKLPEAADPAFKKLIWTPDGTNIGTGTVVAVKTDGEVIVTATPELASEFVPIFDGTSFSRTH